MRVELGNTAPHQNGQSVDLGAPTVTSIGIDDSYTFAGGKLEDISGGLLRAGAHPLGLQLPDHEALVAVIHGGGAWNAHGQSAPSWVWSDNDNMAQLLGEYFRCPVGRPEDLEQTHFTLHGPPGVGPSVPGLPVDPAAGVSMLKVNSGIDLQARIMGGSAVYGEAGTATVAPTATGFTTVSSVNHAANDLVGAVVYTAGVYGVITANTGVATNTVLTVDQWYTPSSPGGAAAATPAAGAYIIAFGGNPCPYVALTANSTAAAATDTALTGEITTAAGGLKRKIAPYAHTAATANYTLTPVFTANASDTLPVTVAKIGVFNSIVPAGGTMLFETLLSATATLSASGDQLTITETVSE